MKARHQRLAEAVAIELQRVPLAVLEGGRSANLRDERDAAFCRAAARAGWPRRFSNPGKLARFVEGVVRLPDVSEVVGSSLLEAWISITGDADPPATFALKLHELVTAPRNTVADRGLSLRALKLALELLLPKEPEARREVFAAAWHRSVSPAMVAEHREQVEAFAFRMFSEGWDAALEEGATSVA